MSDQKLSELSAITSLSDADLLYIASGGNPKKITGANLRADLKSRRTLQVAGQGFISMTGPRDLYLNNTGLTSGVLYAGLLGLLRGDSITNVHVMLQAGGSSFTGIKAKVALMNASGTVVATSGDVSGSLGSSGLATCALSSPYSVTASGAYYAGLLVIASSMPNLYRSGTSSFTAHTAAVGAGSVSYGQQASLSDLPSPSATLSGTALQVWFGVS